MYLGRNIICRHQNEPVKNENTLAIHSKINYESNMVIVVIVPAGVTKQSKTCKGGNWFLKSQKFGKIRIFRAMTGNIWKKNFLCSKNEPLLQEKFPNAKNNQDLRLKIF